MADQPQGLPTGIPSSKFPLPVAAHNFRFLSSPALPTHAILEVDTDTNPVRIAFDKEQLERLAQIAAIAATKVI